MKKFKANIYLLVSFGLLFIGLFMGDGKQPIIDSFAALMIIALYVVARHREQPLRSLSRQSVTAWATLIGFYFVLTLVSDSIGYSVSATMRLIMAFLVYYLFFSITSERIIGLLVRSLILIAGVATLISFVLLRYPPPQGFLPFMNLLYATYGHNHLADLLIIVFPAVVGLATRQSNIKNIGQLALITAGMVFTFARGAWILLILYLLLRIFLNRRSITKQASLYITAVTIGAFLFVSLVSFRAASNNNSLPNQVVRQIQKPSLLEDGRWEYWRQAAAAFKERPLLGSGPGTFYLQSKRLRGQPGVWSWFAHSAPIQTLVETGIVGLALWLVLGSLVFSNIFLKQPESDTARELKYGVILILAYSLTEFSLDYLVIWIIVWASLGVLTPVSRSAPQLPTNQQNSLMITAAWALGIYYFFTLFSYVAEPYHKGTLALVLGAYNADRATLILDKLGNARADQLSMIGPILTTFHQKNPEVLIRLAKQYDNIGNTPVARQYYELTKKLDPQNESNQEARMKFYLSHQEYGSFFPEYARVVPRKRPNRAFKLLREIAFLNQDIPADRYELLGQQLKISSYSSQEVARNLFLLGAALVDTRPTVARQLFNNARMAAPLWSYFHIGLASYYEYYENQPALAQDTLQDCLHFEYAKDYCADIKRLPVPVLDEVTRLVVSIP